MGKLVSIITPIYNGEKFIDMYMKAILSQTYKDIELIIVNDGSTDLTEEKIYSYESEIKKKGIIFKYICKENGGQPSAINKGLEVFTGSYLTWPDCDDRMHEDYVEKKVAYMEQHPEVDYLVSRSAIINLSNSNDVIGYTWMIPPISNDDMLVRIISGINYHYEPGNFFVTADIFKKSIPTHRIYDKCGKWSGPQIQMMLPIIYNGNYGFIEDCLFDYHIHENNDHNKFKRKEDIKRKKQEGRKVLAETIYALNAPDDKKEQLVKMANVRMNKSGMNAAFNYFDYEWYKECYEQLDGNDKSKKDRLKMYILKYTLLKKLYCILKKR